MISMIASLGMGLGLAAASGFRLFVPLLTLSCASYFGNIELGEQFAFVGTLPALITLSVATVVETLARYIPFVDHALDIIAIPAATLAGTFLTASVMTDVSPMVQWATAVIAGGGIATGVQATSAGTRGVSTLTTAGMGNPLFSTLEVIGSWALSICSVLLPLLVIMAVIALAYMIARQLSSKHVDGSTQSHIKP